MKPYIGITCGAVRDTNWSPPMNVLRQTYIDAVVRAGGIPVILPLVDDETVIRGMYERIDGLLLSGGGDVEPRYYGEEPSPELGSTDPVRDRVEIWLTRWAAEDGKPILGICRGVQVLNVALGGSLYQDIPSQVETELVHDGSSKAENWGHMAHDLKIDASSQLAAIIGSTSFPTNSLHHQAVKDVAQGLSPVGWAPDGIVEAVEAQNDEHFMIGVQCHPEALQGETDPRWRALFAAFIERCKITIPV
jgi:putative glutamine amidotransferase